MIKSDDEHEAATVSRPQGPVRQSLLHAAIACIEREGLGAVTIRSIAKEAGVNSALISYYFGSKAAIVGAAVALISRQAFSDWDGVVGADCRDPRRALERFLLHWLQGTQAHPNLTKDLLFSTPTGPEAALVSQFNGFLDTVLARIGTAAFRSPRNAKDSLVQIFSALIFAALTPRLLHPFSGRDLSSPKDQRLFVRHLVKHYLRQARSAASPHDIPRRGRARR